MVFDAINFILKISQTNQYGRWRAGYAICENGNEVSIFRHEMRSQQRKLIKTIFTFDTSSHSQNGEFYSTTKTGKSKRVWSSKLEKKNRIRMAESSISPMVHENKELFVYRNYKRWILRQVESQIHAPICSDAVANRKDHSWQFEIEQQQSQFKEVSSINEIPMELPMSGR